MPLSPQFGAITLFTQSKASQSFYDRRPVYQRLSDAIACYQQEHGLSGENSLLVWLSDNQQRLLVDGDDLADFGRDMILRENAHQLERGDSFGSPGIFPEHADDGTRFRTLALSVAEEYAQKPETRVIDLDA